MGFFSHAMCLGVGYVLGKRYIIDYRVTPPNDTQNSSEFSVRVKESDDWYRGFWHHRPYYWNHAGCCGEHHHPHRQVPHQHQNSNQKIDTSKPPAEQLADNNN